MTYKLTDEETVIVEEARRVLREAIEKGALHRSDAFCEKCSVEVGASSDILSAHRNVESEHEHPMEVISKRSLLSRLLTKW